MAGLLWRNGLKIKIDSREQRKLDFSDYEIVTMPYGDYGATWDTGEGMPLVFERKSLGDLWTTLSNTDGHERFKRELERAAADKVKVVLLLEPTLQEVLAGCKHSRMPGATMTKKLFTFWVKYGLTPVFAGSRSAASRIVIETFEAIERSYKPGRMPTSGTLPNPTVPLLDHQG